MKDFLQQEFDVNDTVIYAAMSGRSCYLVKATVVEFRENGNITLQPVTESWGGGSPRSGQTRYIDKRTGKGINPEALSKKHILDDHHWTYLPTGERVGYYDRELHMQTMGISGWSKYSTEELTKYRFESATYKDYVEKVEAGPKKVTLSRTDNIVLIEKSRMRERQYPQPETCGDPAHGRRSLGGNATRSQGAAGGS